MRRGQFLPGKVAATNYCVKTDCMACCQFIPLFSNLFWQTYWRIFLKIPVISPEYLFDSWLNRLRINWCVRPSWGCLFRANAQWAFKNQDKQTDGNKLEWSHREIVSLPRYIMSSVLPPAPAQVAGGTAPTVLQQTPVRPLEGFRPKAICPRLLAPPLLCPLPCSSRLILVLTSVFDSS